MIELALTALVYAVFATGVCLIVLLPFALVGAVLVALARLRRRLARGR